MSKYVEKLKIITLILILFSIIYLYNICVYGFENNLSTSQEDDITRQYLNTYDQEAITEQKEVFDFYRKQKELMEENVKLRAIIEKQEIENEEKKHEIEVAEQGKQEAIPIEAASTAKKAEEVGKQVAKETTRVVQQAKQANKEVKRILKKL